ncbi:hypothetical protein HXA31_17220 [Salipaludibacillus agaradhaerens]|jgi:4-hydroxybenzoate polyprenyltransferase|uniref:Uncharacterized protein n=1 Tax=Salipaludibacillus agaradhaerens TaxID=76935 RepID=A0A9Q4B4J5_SALAG|nr:hypothetical protein [Salipaludibacillus agaradhaerens]MCR6098288.1 hypothetical protein [Salipaludibacillus agaradhaerens]MCR6116082.1 hypothetical protein [Salipaludibacillus agaradhaerens]
MIISLLVSSAIMIVALFIFALTNYYNIGLIMLGASILITSITLSQKISNRGQRIIFIVFQSIVVITILIFVIWDFFE